MCCFLCLACDVCYLPFESALASMPTSPSESPVLKNLNYVVEDGPVKHESNGGSPFGGYPSLQQRGEYFNIKESMTVHCGYVYSTLLLQYICLYFF